MFQMISFITELKLQMIVRHDSSEERAQLILVDSIWIQFLKNWF